MKVTDTTDLTSDQRAKLAFALEMIRATQGDVRGWSQHRIPVDGTPRYLYLQRWRKGKIEQVYYVCQEPMNQLPFQVATLNLQRSNEATE